jgi:hypothetical protein
VYFHFESRNVINSPVFSAAIPRYSLNFGILREANPKIRAETPDNA